MTNAAYLASAGLCIGSIACLSQQSTARMGNALGLIGVSSGIAATVGLLPSDPAILAQIAGAHCHGVIARHLADQGIVRAVGCARLYSNKLG